MTGRTPVDFIVQTDDTFYSAAPLGDQATTDILHIIPILSKPVLALFCINPEHEARSQQMLV